MTSAKATALPLSSEEDDDESGPLEPWQKAWLAKHRDTLILRVPTMDVVDRLIQRHAIDTSMDIFQCISACHEALRNERARLLLDYVGSQTQRIFWDFQEALVLESCRDLAVRRGDVQEVVESFSAMELSAAAAPCQPAKKPRPASVEKAVEEMKSRYRERNMPSLDGQVPLKAVSLDVLHVNICLLSVEKLDALSGCGGQRQPFAMSSLKEKKSSVVELEDLFTEDEHGKVPRMQVASGIAGSGKTMAFTLKATYEWAKKGRRRPFWENITMYFEGSLTDPDWWDAKTIAEVFGLPNLDLTAEEEKEVARYICSHAKEVLLVADSMDEADVKTDSFLWRVLTGNCKAVEGLKVIICSRPCAKTSWLAKTYLFDRHLEVVGFTEEKIGQFIESYFGRDSAKGHKLRAQLVGRPEVQSLMHTPLLATMICRWFDSDTSGALPATQTAVYEEAALAMVRQSAAQDSGDVPSTILAELSPEHLHVAVVNLSRLAYHALAKKSVVFRKSELEEASCLGYAVQLGLLSSSPGTNIARRAQDVYSFPHHTMLEFFAAVHAVRQLIGAGKKTIGDLVSELGVDGDLSRFWVFMSGLLGGEQCETLLNALATCPRKTTIRPEISRLLVLLIECYAECESKLQEQRSATVANAIAAKGLWLPFTHLSVSQAQAVSRVIQRYSTELHQVFLHYISMDTSSIPLIIAGLQECQNLTHLHLPEFMFAPESIDAVTNIIEKNTSSLYSLSIPASDGGSPVSMAVMSCTRLKELSIGSQALTNAGSQLVADVLRQQRDLHNFHLTGKLDDDGFAPIARVLCSMGENLIDLNLQGMQLSSALISSTLSSLTNLCRLSLCEVPIGDVGLRQIERHLVRLRRVDLHNVGLTPLSIPTLAMLVRRMPANGECEVAVQRSLFKPTDETIAEIEETTSLKLVWKESFSTPVMFHGLQIKNNIKFQTDEGQSLFFVI